MKKLLAVTISLGVLFAAVRARAGILTQAPGDDSCNPVSLAPYSWPFEQRVSYWKSKIYLAAAGEDARKAYSAEWALFEIKKPTIPRSYSGYGHLSYWGLLPFRVRSASEPRKGTGLFVRGLSNEAALAFVREHRVELGVATAPELVHVTEPVVVVKSCYGDSLVDELPRLRTWTFTQVPLGPVGIACDGCSASVTIDRQTLQVIEIESGMIDLPHSALPPPPTTAYQALQRFREMRPDAELTRPPKVHPSYAQDVFGGVDIVWEIAIRNGCGQEGDYRSRAAVQWVALDARNLAIRGYDMGTEDRSPW